MNLTFDSIGELNQFINWATHFGREDYTPEPAVAGVSGGSGDVCAAGAGALKWEHPTTDTTGVAFDTPPSVVTTPAETGSDPVTEQATANAAEPAPRRKRRAKAEIEADNKTAGAGHVDVARVVHEDGSVTTTSIGLPPDVNPSEVTPAPTGTNPFEQPAATAAADTPAADDGDTVVTPFQHLTRAREFIAKHGMPKYNETFTKAALDANVMGYSAYQRALHMSAMDELDKA